MGSRLAIAYRKLLLTDGSVNMSWMAVAPTDERAFQRLVEPHRALQPDGSGTLFERFGLPDR